MRVHILTLIIILSCRSPLAACCHWEPSPFDDVPRGHWAYGALTQLQNGSLLPCGWSGPRDYSKKILNRYQAAILTAKATERAVMFHRNGRSIRAGDLATLGALATEFERDLGLLQISGTSMKRDVIRLLEEQVANDEHCLPDLGPLLMRLERHIHETDPRREPAPSPPPSNRWRVPERYAIVAPAYVFPTPRPALKLFFALTVALACMAGAACAGRCTTRMLMPIA